MKKYIHEIKVDLKGSREKKVGSLNDKPTLKDVEKLADTLCEKEPTYLNVNIISRTQVSLYLPMNPFLFTMLIISLPNMLSLVLGL